MKNLFGVIFLILFYPAILQAQTDKKVNAKDAKNILVLQKGNVKDSTANTSRSDAFLKVKRKTPEQIAMQKHPGKIDSIKTVHPH